MIAVLIGLLLLAFRFFAPAKQVNFSDVSILDIAIASFASFGRLFIAYFFALVIAVPLVIFTTRSAQLERILLPIYDILQSVPALAFFPAVVLVFIKFRFFEGAAIFVIFIAMLWNMVFSMIAGLKVIPLDIQSAATIFGAKGLKKLWYLTLPAILPYIVTGSLLAWAQGWTILIVSEVLHNYIPGSTPVNDLFGLGSLLANSLALGNNLLFLYSLVAMIIIISLMDFFIWQNLLKVSEKYKFD